MKRSPTAPGSSLTTNALAICTNTVYSQRQVAVVESTTSVLISDQYSNTKATGIPGYLPLCRNLDPPPDDSFVLYTINSLGKNDWMVIVYLNASQMHTSALGSQSFLMRQCLLALARIFYGVKRHEKRVLRGGMNLYGGALNMLSSSFRVKESNITIEMVGSVLLLSMIEVDTVLTQSSTPLTCLLQSILPTGKTSWISHILGLEHLFALLQPSKLEGKHSFEYAMLKSCQPVMILGAFFTQKPSIMGDPAWRAAMRDQGRHNTINMTETRTSPSLSFLMDILAELPQLFMHCDECTLSTRTESVKTSPQFVAALCSRVSHLRKTIADWKDEWDSEFRGKMYEILSTNEANSIQILGWITVFYFSSVDVAITFAMYHSVVILVNGIAAALFEAGLWIPFGSECNGFKPCAEFSSEMVLASIRSSIRSICRTVEYNLHTTQSAREHADFYLFFPIHVARRASIQFRQSPETTWLTKAFEIMRLSYPMGIWANMDFGDRFNGLGEGMFG